MTSGRNDIDGLSLDPPDRLYHYTSAEGVKGIVESGCIWASDLAFLNDRQELLHGLELLREAMYGHEDGRWASSVRTIMGLKDSPPMLRVMAACFCKDGDLLSQWRGYGRRGGFAIGFDTSGVDALHRMEGKSAFTPVSYMNERSKELAEEWARIILKAWGALVSSDAWQKAGSGERSDLESLAKAMYEFRNDDLWPVVMSCAMIKDPSFAEEHEWRIVRQGLVDKRYGRQETLFRVGPLGLTPYIEVDLRNSDGLLPIAEVVVGPGTAADLRASAVEMLLHKHGYADVEVRHSEVPYRP